MNCHYMQIKKDDGGHTMLKNYLFPEGWYNVKDIDNSADALELFEE